MKDYTTLCSSAPGEFLARAALGIADELAGRSRDIILANLDRARTFMERWSDVLEWREPVAGPVAFIRLREGSATAFCERVRQGAGVLLVPSPLFDWGDAHLRFGLGRLAVPRALEALGGELEAAADGSA